MSRLIFGRGLRGMRADIAMLTHELKCGWRAAHASMAHHMPVLSWRHCKRSRSRALCPKPHPCRRIHGATLVDIDRGQGLPSSGGMLSRVTIGGSGDPPRIDAVELRAVIGLAHG